MGFFDGSDFSDITSMSSDMSYSDPQYSLDGAGAGMSGSGYGSMFQQPDPIINTALTALDQPANMPVPEVQGSGSWFKQLVGGMLIGLGRGAGAPNAAEAFSQGFQGVWQQREYERQVAIQNQELAQRQEMFEANLAKTNTERLALESSMANASEELKLKSKQLQADFLLKYQASGKEPVVIADSIEEAAEMGKEMGLGLHNVNPVEGPDGKWYIFQTDMDDMWTGGPIDVLGTMINPSDFGVGLPSSSVLGLMTTAIKGKYDQEQAELDRQNRLGVANIGANATIKAAEARGTYGGYGMGNAIDDQRQDKQFRMNQINQQINDLQQFLKPMEETIEYGEDLTPEQTTQYQQYQKQIETLMQERMQLSSNAQTPGGQVQYGPAQPGDPAPGSIVRGKDGSTYQFLGRDPQTGKIIAIPQ